MSTRVGVMEPGPCFPDRNVFSIIWRVALPDRGVILCRSSYALFFHRNAVEFNLYMILPLEGRYI